MIDIHPVTRNCESIYQRAAHAILGVSPFNSYFSLETITTLSDWARRRFKDFTILIPDHESMSYTLMALGYDNAKASKKAKKEARYLKNKCIKAMTALGFSENEAESSIIDFRSLKESEDYVSVLEFYQNKYTENPEFRTKCMEVSKLILQAQSSNVTTAKVETAVKYLLAELPVVFNGADILAKKEAVFCYRSCPPFFREGFELKDNNAADENQGFLIVHVDAPRSS